MIPPLVGVAANVTEVPAHTGLALATMLTLTGRIGLTVIVAETVACVHSPVVEMV